MDKKEYLLAAINIYNMVDNDRSVPLPTDNEYKFHDKMGWKLDYAYSEIKIGVEVHGGVFSNGRHVRGKGFIEDRDKMNEAQLCGWIVLEFSTTTLLDNPIKCVEQLGAAIKLREK